MGFRQESENQLNLQSVVLFLASVFCLRQTQEYTGEPFYPGYSWKNEKRGSERILND
jgi:hypothetical protein